MEKEHYLEEEEAAFQERESERLVIMERCENGEIDEMYRDLLLNQIPSNKTKHNALLQVNDEYHMLKDLQEKEGLAVEYVYRTPWKALLEEKAMKKYALQLEIALLTMLLVLSSSGAIEKGSSMDKLITVSVTGRKGVLTRKVTLSLLLATLVMLCSLLPGLVKIFHTYGVYGLSSPAASYFARNIFLMEITLGVLLLLIHLLFYLIILFATLVLFFISEKIGNRIAVLLIGTVLFLIPTLAFILV